MSGFFVYLRLQLRRAARHLPFVLAVTLLLAAAAGLVGTLLSDSRRGSAAQQKVDVGLVGSIDSGYLRMALFALENVDSSRYALTFSPMTEDEAREGLLAGRLNAYIVIPEGFSELLGSRGQIPATYVTTNGAAGVGTRLLDELADSVSHLLLEAENAMLGMGLYADRYAPEADRSAAIDLLSLRFLNAVLNRSGLLRVQTVGFGDSLSFFGYYLCALLTLFLTLWGLSAAPLFSARSRGLCGVLTLRGLRPVGQTLAEFLAFGALLILSTGLVLCAAMALLGSVGLAIPELEELPARLLLVRALWLLPVGLMLASLSYFLYELVPDGVGSLLLQFLTAILLGYLSGCLYPAAFFPDALRFLGELLPTGVARRTLSSVLTRGSPGALVWAVFGYTLLFLACSALLRRGRLRGGAQ